MPNKPNYIVLDNGTLFYSHITQDDVTQFNDHGWLCGMEAKVTVVKFTWAEKVKTTLNVVNSKCIWLIFLTIFDVNTHIEWQHSPLA